MADRDKGIGFRQPNTAPAWTYASPGSGRGMGLSGRTDQIQTQTLRMTPEVRPGLGENEVAARIVRPRKRRAKIG